MLWSLKGSVKRRRAALWYSVLSWFSLLGMTGLHVYPLLNNNFICFILSGDIYLHLYVLKSKFTQLLFMGNLGKIPCTWSRIKD